MDTVNTILMVFGLMVLMFVFTGAGIGINVLISRRNKLKVVEWLESRGCWVEKIEWVLHPSSSPRLWFLKYSSFDVRFVDGAGKRHKGVVVVPTWCSPELVEDEMAT